MQRVRFYFADTTIVDGFIEGTTTGDIRLIDLMNSTANRRKFGVSECMTIKNGIQMLYREKATHADTGSAPITADEENGREVPLDFILNENLELAQTISLEQVGYNVNLGNVLFAHSLSDFKGAQGERKRALKTTVPFDVSVVTSNHYLLEGKIMVPSLNRELPKDIQPGKRFLVLSQVKMRYIPSPHHLYRMHDHLIVNTDLIKAFY